MIDRRNFHLFQPLLYQVATGGLSPADIASPLRGILARQRNARVVQGSVTDIDTNDGCVHIADKQIEYDFLIVASGSKHHYFGNDSWEKDAPGLKTVEDALDMRRRVLTAFEQAENEEDPQRRSALLNFVIVGGGPTGVELAGALGELANHTLRKNFRNIDPSDSKILLIEGADRILQAFPESLSEEAAKSLIRLGVTLRTNTFVDAVDDTGVTLRTSDGSERIDADTILWGAGVIASPLGRSLAESTGAELDQQGRVMVEVDLSVAGHPNVFVIGDLARCDQDGRPLPGVAPVAMQQGEFVARLIQRRLRGQEAGPFRYKDRGSMAVIGRAAAVAKIGPLKLHGYPAWVAWLFIHLINLVEYQNRVSVLIQWGWNYLTRNRSARIITFPELSANWSSEIDLKPAAGEVSRDQIGREREVASDA